MIFKTFIAFAAKRTWEPVKCYFADLVCNGVHPPPPPLRINCLLKNKLRTKGFPLYRSFVKKIRKETKRAKSSVFP